MKNVSDLLLFVNGFAEIVVHISTSKINLLARSNIRLASKWIVSRFLSGDFWCI